MHRGQVDKARTGNIGLLDQRMTGNGIEHGLGQFSRIFLRLLGGRHGAIALERPQLGTCGRANTAQLPRKLKGSKRVAQHTAELIGN